MAVWGEIRSMRVGIRPDWTLPASALILRRATVCHVCRDKITMG